jgi:hypothetical protein
MARGAHAGDGRVTYEKETDRWAGAVGSTCCPGAWSLRQSRGARAGVAPLDKQQPSARRDRGQSRNDNGDNKAHRADSGWDP